MFPKIAVSQNGWFIKENPIKIVPLFSETPMEVSWKVFVFVLTFRWDVFFLCFDILVGMLLSFIPSLLGWKI